MRLTAWLAILGSAAGCAGSGPADGRDASGRCDLGWGPDADGDGFTAAPRALGYAAPEEGWTTAVGDCDDDDRHRYESAPEVCDPDDRDEDCDRRSDNADLQPPIDTVTWYRDRDGDGWGDPNRAEINCDPVEGYVSRSGDCADYAVTRNPDAVDPCQTDAVDEDCDGTPTLYVDEDGDGFGAAPATCEQPGAADSGDCDDADPGLNPAAAEICGDGLDQDCNGNALGCGLEGSWLVSDAQPRLPGGAVRGGDVDGDGQTDLLVRGIDETHRLYSGPFDATLSPTAAPTLTIPPAGARKATWLADLDGDGRDEVLVEELGESDPRLWVDLGARSGNIESGAATHVIRGARYVRGALDSDGDGADEILARSSDGSGAVLLGGFGAGDWQAADVTVANVPGVDWPSVAGDVDGDGLDDLVWSAEAEIVVAYGPVRGTLTAMDADLHITGGGDATAGGDLDGDGLGDLAVRASGVVPGARDHCPEYPPSTVFVLTAPLPADLLDADATITAPALEAVLGAGDFDGDGADELLLRTTSGCDFPTSTAHVVAGPFLGALHPPSAQVAYIDSPTGYDWFSSAAVGDLDGDGVDDLALGGGAEAWLFFGGPGF